jgi:orotate phosphoribosyltransferase-like protein
MNKQINETTFAGLATKSAKIRYLASIGFSTSEIAKKLDIRYQHARNVLLQNNKKPIAKPVDAMSAGDLGLES